MENKKIGLWKKEKNGKNYLSGFDKETGIGYSIFPNTYKKEQNQPDYNLLIFASLTQPQPIQEISKNDIVAQVEKFTKEYDDEVPF